MSDLVGNPRLVLSHQGSYCFRDRVDEKKLARNIHILAEALARHVYNLTSQGNIQLFNEALVGYWCIYISTSL